MTIAIQNEVYARQVIHAVSQTCKNVMLNNSVQERNGSDGNYVLAVLIYTIENLTVADAQGYNPDHQNNNEKLVENIQFNNIVIEHRPFTNFRHVQKCLDICARPGDVITYTRDNAEEQCHEVIGTVISSDGAGSGWVYTTERLTLESNALYRLVSCNVTFNLKYPYEYMSTTIDIRN